MPEGIRWTSRPGQPVRVQWAALAHGFCWSARYRGFVFCVCAAFCRECVGGRRRRRKETPKFSLGLIFFLSLSLPSLICRRKNSVRQSNKQLAIISRKGKKNSSIGFFWNFGSPAPQPSPSGRSCSLFFFSFFLFPLSLIFSSYFCHIVGCVVLRDCVPVPDALVGRNPRKREKERESGFSHCRIIGLDHTTLWPPFLSIFLFFLNLFFNFLFSRGRSFRFLRLQKLLAWLTRGKSRRLLFGRTDRAAWAAVSVVAGSHLLLVAVGFHRRRGPSRRRPKTRSGGGSDSAAEEDTEGRESLFDHPEVLSCLPWSTTTSSSHLVEKAKGWKSKEKSPEEAIAVPFIGKRGKEMNDRRWPERKSLTGLQRRIHRWCSAVQWQKSETEIVGWVWSNSTVAVRPSNYGPIESTDSSSDIFLIIIQVDRKESGNHLPAAFRYSPTWARSGRSLDNSVRVVIVIAEPAKKKKKTIVRQRFRIQLCAPDFVSFVAGKSGNWCWAAWTAESGREILWQDRRWLVVKDTSCCCCRKREREEVKKNCPSYWA